MEGFPKLIFFGMETRWSGMQVLELGIFLAFLLAGYLGPGDRDPLVGDTSFTTCCIACTLRRSFLLPLLAIEEELARRRMNEAGKIGRDMQLGVGSNEPPPSEGQVRDIAKRRQEATIPQKGQKGFQPVSSSNELHINLLKEQPQVRDIVAKKVGVKPTTFERAKAFQVSGRSSASVAIPFVLRQAD
jgi:hypothetical protein